MGKVNRRSCLLLSCAFAWVAPITPALAQQDGTAPAPSAADDGEIVVTAQRREQALSDVGISVSVVQTDAIAERGVVNAADLSKVVAGFTAADSSLNVPIYTLRGVGFNEGSLGANATVGIYVDEVPLAYPAMTQGALLDLQRVEVLKGPQGTLYGQNSTGGTINYIANKPSDTPEGALAISVARFNTIRGQAAVGGPLSDTLKARISADFTLGSDWQRSVTRPGDELGQVNRGAARALFTWEPTSALTVDLNLNGWYDKSDTQALQLTGFFPARAANVPRLPEVFNSPLAPADARAADWTPGLSYARNDRFLQAALKIGYDLTADVRLTSISSFSDYDTKALIDRDGMVPVNFEVRTDGHIKSWYQELRLSGDTGGLTWSLGGNYRNDKIEDLQDSSIRNGTSTLAAYQRTPVFGNQKVETWGVFADGELAFTSTLSAVAGIRYTKDMRDFAGCTADSGAGDLAAFFTPVVNGLRGARGLAPIAAIPGGACVTLDQNLVPGLQSKSLDEDNISYHAGLNWKPAPRTLIYGSVSRGYKAGAFATIGSTTEVQLRPVTQERVDAYEIGVKASPFGSMFQFSGAGFYYDYRDKQQRGRILDPTFGSLSTLVNVPKSPIWGLEFDASMRPVPPLTVYASYLYLNTRIENFSGINFANVLENFAGQRLNFSPTHSANIGASFDQPLTARLTGFVGADVTYRSATSAFFGNVAGQEIDAYRLLDLRAGVRDDDAGWRLSVFGNNVLNEYYWNNVIRSTDGVARSAGRPVSYGVEFGFKF